MLCPPHALRCSALALLLSPLLAYGQSAPTDDRGWELGLGVGARSPLYAGEQGLAVVFPFIGYEGERFFIDGPKVGVKLVDKQNFRLDVHVSALFEGIDAEDFGRGELAARGIDRDLLDDRDFGVDGGLSATWQGAAGRLGVDIRGDVSGVNEGYQASLDYRYPIKAGDVVIVPGVGVTHVSGRRADYYYGTSRSEVARGVVDYRPGDVLMPNVGVTVIAPLGERWRLVGGLSATGLPEKLKDSPLIERDADVSAGLFGAITRRF